MLVLHLVLLFSGAMAFVQQSRKPMYDLEDAENLFEDFMKEHNKHYNEQEKNKRLAIFKRNLLKINELNSKPGQTAVFGINHFADLSAEEFKSKYLGFKLDPTHNKNVSFSKVLVAKGMPDHFDWRDHKAVTAVKNQEHCGSCWAFSTTGTIEGAYARKHKQLVAFSEQQLVDCDRTDDNQGCFGGDMSSAIHDLIKTGIETEEDYPYIAKDSDCVFNAAKVKAKITGQERIRMENDVALRQAIIDKGPISIALHVDTDFQLYIGGIFTDCSDGTVNHGVLLIGYGKSDEGVPYWLIKNSWGMWGEHGYMYMSAQGSTCSMKSYPGVVALVA